MARNPFQRGFLGDVGTGFAGGFGTGMGQGIDIFKALSTLELAKQQAAATASNNDFNRALGLRNLAREESKYNRDLQKDSDADMFGGSTGNNVTPYGGLPINNTQTGFPTANFPQPPVNQQQVGANNAQPGQMQQQDPLDTLSQQTGIHREFFKPEIPYRSDGHLKWAAAQRSLIANSALSPDKRRNLLERVDRLQGDGTQDRMKPFDEEVSKAVDDSKLTPEADRELAEARLFENSFTDQANLYQSINDKDLTGSGKYTKSDGYGWHGQPQEKPGSIERGAKLTSLAKQGKYGPFEHFDWNWNKLKTPTANEIKYKDQYEQTVQALSALKVKGDRGSSELNKADAREWLADPNLDNNYYRDAFKGDIQDAKDLIKTIKAKYENKFDASAYSDLGSKLESIDLTTPKKANAVVKSMIEQGIPHKQAMSIVAPIAQEQVKAKKQGVPMQQILFGDLGKQSKETKLPTIQKPAARKTMSITVPNATGGAEIVLPRRDRTPTITPNNASEMINSKVDEAPDFYINEKGEKKRGYAPYPQEALPPKSQNIHPDAAFINKVAKHPKTIQNIRKLAATIRSTNGKIVNDKVLNSLDRNGLMMMDLALALIEKEDFSNVA